MTAGQRVRIDLFGQRLLGEVVRHWTETSYGETVEWVAVRLDRPAVIGGVGPARDWVNVAPRCVEVLA